MTADLVVAGVGEALLVMVEWLPVTATVLVSVIAVTILVVFADSIGVLD